MATKTKVIVVAGGLGNRFSGHYIPKQFVEINTKPLLAYTLEAVQKNSQISETILVINKNYEMLYKDIIRTYKIDRVRSVYGGRTRQESIFNGLTAISDTDYVLVQNAVCPLTSPELIKAVLDTSIETGQAASAYIEVVDTIARAHDEIIDECIIRSSLVKLQAPQAFPYEIIKKCHEKAIADGLTNVTNDAILITHYGYKMHLVRGDFNNIKVTTTEDWLLAKVILGKELKSWKA